MNKIYSKKTITQHLYNEGKNEDNLKFEKQTMLFDAIRNNIDLIKTNKQYPQNDLQDIELELDVIVITKEEFNKWNQDFFNSIREWNRSWNSYDNKITHKKPLSADEFINKVIKG